MGLRCELNIYKDWGFPEKTSWGGILINYSEVIAYYTKLMYDSMIEKVPVLTGNLRHSLNWHSTNSGFVIETECEYAEYVEYGTCYMDAQPYFEQAIEEYAEELFEALKPIYTNTQSAALRGELDRASAREAQSAEFGGGGFGSVSQAGSSSGPKMKVVWPKIGPFRQTPSGKMRAQSYQISNPNMWRPGTTMYDYSIKLHAMRSKYFDGNGRSYPKYRPRVEFERESSSSSSGGSKGAFAFGMTSSGDKAFDLALSIGELVGITIATNGAGLDYVIAGALVGIVLTVAIYLLLRNLIDALGMDPGADIDFHPLEVEVI